MNQYDGPLIGAYRKVTGQARAYINQKLPATRFSGPEALTTAQTRWAAVERNLDLIDDVLSNLSREVPALYFDAELSSEGRDRRIASLVQSRRAEYDTARTAALTAVKGMLATLQVAAMPARPAPADAAQEARLAGLKADLLMVTSRSEEPAQVVEQLGRFLSRALSEDDALAVWLLAGSPWASDLIVSRPWAASQHQSAELLWQQQAARLLGAVGDSEQKTLRTLYLAASNPKHGLPQLAVMLEGFAGRVFDDLASTVRPSAGGFQRITAPGR